MYSKQESALVKRKFWTSLGLYMKPIHNSIGEEVNWLNYKTGTRHIYFRMDATTYNAWIAIEVRHPDKSIQQAYFKKLSGLQGIFNSVAGDDWVWDENYLDENGISISRISKTLENVSIFNEADWPAIITFLKPRLISLDEFWEQVKDGLD